MSRGWDEGVAKMVRHQRAHLLLCNCITRYLASVRLAACESAGRLVESDGREYMFENSYVF